ncbi:RagB/SusD family nutrient uptake outer membrane protein [Butyricimonas paravirosa]|uniref:RagB/SusD family nutrient uptake outer membrane protein n=1 Tax=Butyricimonas paravirosa TaxID=1472417 RepID=UPI00210D9969|nr:RagB/SusD family nutrient uptake outer membrane protein [Butyricimonas paravirosa]MCQ4873172.1 RagB/SusD family nutrient uptake outer membrane protein [Butyricimonas paravirosa]
MKKLMNKSIILSLILALTSCNDWLNVSPKTDMKAEDLFSTEAGFRDALIGVYALMSTSTLYGKNLSYAYMDALAQYYASPRSNTSTGYDHSLKNAAGYNYTEKGEESRILSIWSSHFSAIANINQALLFIDAKRDVFTSEDIHHIYKGEFLALRALLHFNVLRLFASSPIMDNQNGLNSLAIPYVEVYTNVAQPQLTVKEVLVKIEKDLLAARDLMKDRETFNNTDSSSPMYKRRERMNYYAVTALLARVYLYGNEKEAALTTAKEIIGEVDGENSTSYTLATSAATATNPMFQSELIFTLDVQKLKNLSESSFAETSLSDVLLMSVKGKQNIFNAGGLENDFRSSWLTLTSSGNEYVLAKYNGMNYIPMFKLSELYLIAAECANGKEAYGYLNKLRNHRGLVSVEETQNIEDYIYQEYRREFLGEGQLFFYYKRKLFDAIGAEDNVGIEDLKTVYNLPIPTSEIDFGNIKN